MKVKSDLGNKYVEFWLLALHELLGWDRRRAIPWIVHFEEELNAESTQLWREPPAFYIAFLLIPDAVKESLTPWDRVVLAGRLERAVSQGAIWQDAIDWQQARQRIDSILAEYGESLERVRCQYDV
jgi:hypothetical protein